MIIIAHCLACGARSTAFPCNNGIQTLTIVNAPQISVKNAGLVTDTRVTTLPGTNETQYYALLLK